MLTLTLKRRNILISMLNEVPRSITYALPNAVERRKWKRVEVLSRFPILEATDEIEELARTYMEKIGFPAKAIRDAAHLAFACGYRVDYLVTWNCSHIANAEFRRRLWAINSSIGFQTPVICTPEELMGEEV